MDARALLRYQSLVQLLVRIAFVPKTLLGTLCPLQHVLIALDTTGMPHNTNNLRMWTLQAKELARNRFGVHIVAVTGDNAANMATSRQSLGVDNLLAYGCQAHLMQLAIKSFTNEKNRKGVIDSVLTVLKAFRLTHTLAGELKRLGVPRPMLPSEVRWGSVFRSLAYYARKPHLLCTPVGIGAPFGTFRGP